MAKISIGLSRRAGIANMLDLTSYFCGFVKNDWRYVLSGSPRGQSKIYFSVAAFSNWSISTLVICEGNLVSGSIR